jgi:alanyl-tRNA synthetase
VFMQFDRSSDGVLTPLPKPSIDTGMGLERIACVLQGVLSNYHTDLFTPLIVEAEKLTGATSKLHRGPGYLVEESPAAASLRIIADHSRAATFLIADGVYPANEGRGYVLRKILRRGIRHGRIIGQEQPFMNKMVYAVRDEMQTAYPELVDHADRISKVVLEEEKQFARTITSGLREFEWLVTKSARMIKSASIKRIAVDRPELEKPLEDAFKDAVRHRDDQLFFEKAQTLLPSDEFQKLLNTWMDANRHLDIQLTGADAFKLYDTYGLPQDFIEDLCRDYGIHFDELGFKGSMEMQRNLARASWKGGSQKSANPVYRDLPKTEFEGYTALRIDGARVLALVKDGLGVNQLTAGEEGEAVLDATSFYADSGGQVGDVGWLVAADHQTVLAEVTGCTKPVQGVFAHKVLAKQTIAVGDVVDTVVNGEVRAATMRNHTGTHLLHAALREVLGKHVKQAGSLNNPARLRFDFSHFAAVAEPELREVESIVNAQVLKNTPVQTLVDVPIDVAVNEYGAMALFGEKYGDRVRVVKIGDFSTELCGGTHIAATGEIGVVKLVGESSVASGVRRVEAITGTTALEEFRSAFQVARVVPGGEAALRAKLQSDEEEIKRLRRELDQMRLKAASASVADAAAEAVEVKGVRLLARRVDAVDKAQMRDLVDQLRGKLGSGVVVLGAANEGKVTLIAGVTKDLTGRLQAGKIVAALAPLVGGKGGGRPDLAEAGGSDAGALDGALAKAAELVGGMLG